MAAQTLPLSSEPPRSTICNHDVFLSFRGEDTRKNFTDHLYSALMRVGIRTFRDDEELNRGENISIELLNAIRGSRISIVVFSKSYASSRWCLDELVAILHYKKTIGHTLLPIFYHVNPSNVRKQTGTFAEAFVTHEKKFQADMQQVQRWRAALTEAADYSGWDLQSVANGYESNFIEKIVEEVSCKMKPAGLYVAEHLVGIEYRVRRIEAILSGTSGFRIVGICGIGGIGKTTLAKAVYNQICGRFQGSSFLLNIKEISEQPNGLVHLQEQLLFDILKMKNLKIGNVDGGINLIMERLHRKRVLVVLDDVDHLKQLQALVGNSEWVGPGSRVIVTTRDKHLLTELKDRSFEFRFHTEVELERKEEANLHPGSQNYLYTYEVQEMDRWESLQLFSWHAFKMPCPIEDYHELSIDVTSYASGLPLALKILGSYLSGRSIIEWKSALEKLKKFPHPQIQKILRISFDSLDDDTMDIVLDIACFFIGMDKEYVCKILHGCGFFLDIGISILIQRSLVIIDCKNKLRMHDLIRDMAREVVRERSPRDLGKRSRLWFHEDVLNVLNKHTGSEAVEGLSLNVPVRKYVHLKTKAFANMKNLRLLQIDNVHLTGCCEHLSKELRWLCWHKCPLEFLPPDFDLENLVILDMQHSKVKQICEEYKIFNKLKILNLSHSKDLTQSPKFLQAPCLERLILEGCTSLVEVHESIGCLESLILLDLKECKNLRALPTSISNLKSLETLRLSGCLKLDQLPENLGNMRALKVLPLDKTAFKQLPSSLCLLKNLTELILKGCTNLVELHESIGDMTGLTFLNLKGCKNLSSLPKSISNLKSLETLRLSRCLKLDKLPEELGDMIALKELIADRTAIKQLPSSLGLLKNLNRLILKGCTTLVELHESIGDLKVLAFLDLKECKNLRSLPSNISNLVSVKILHLSGCSKLDRLPEEMGNMIALKELIADGTAIKQLPSSFGLLKNLEELILEGCTSLVEVHESIGRLQRLTFLNLRARNTLRNLPDGISGCPASLVLYVDYCTSLQSLRLPASLRRLSAVGCTSMERIKFV